MQQRLRAAACAAVIPFVLSFAIAAGTPDAGQLLREQSAPPSLPARPPASETPAPAAATPRDSGGPTIAVKEFRFQGYEGLATEAELRAATDELLGRPVGLGELQGAVERISTLLRQKGFLLARAYLPKQDVTEGRIEIAIVQARVDGAIGIKADGTLRLSQSLLRSMAEDVVRPGQPLRERDLERVLLLMRELPGVNARVLLEQGENPGTTRVVFDVSERPRVSGGAWFDNHGNRHTGAWRGNAMVSINNPLRRGDQLTGMLVGAEGLLQGRFGYSTPLGSRGLRGSASFTMMQYELIGGLSSLRAKGDALTFNAGLSQPLVRRRETSVSAILGYEYKTLSDEMFGITIRDKVLHSGTAGLNGSRFDRLGGGGLTTWSASSTIGHLDLSGVRADENIDRVGPKTAGAFSRFNFTLARQQRVNDRTTLSGSYFGQLAFQNLDSSEKFSLGGPYGVRAYPVGEASGDSGHLFNFEARRDLLARNWGTLQANAFFDAGLITLNADEWPNAVVTATGKNEYTLTGAGVGLSLTHSNRYSLRLNYAQKIGSNPGRTVQGMDADGRDDDGRFWLTGQLSL